MFCCIPLPCVPSPSAESTEVGVGRWRRRASSAIEQGERNVCGVPHALVPDDALILIVTLNSITGLERTDLFSGCDPYVEFELHMTQKSSVEALGSQKKQSTRRERTMNPVWEPPELFGFALDSQFKSVSRRAYVLCTVYDYNRFTESKAVAQTTLSLRKLKFDEILDADKECELSLHDPESGEDLGSGKLCLSVSLVSKEQGLSVATERVYELQRLNPVLGTWGSSAEHLVPTDPGKWATSDNQYFPTISEAGMTLSDRWQAKAWVCSSMFGEDGWQYSYGFHVDTWLDEHKPAMVVRRRLWYREIFKLPESSEERKQAILAMSAASSSSLSSLSASSSSFSMS